MKGEFSCPNCGSISVNGYLSHKNDCSILQARRENLMKIDGREIVSIHPWPLIFHANDPDGKPYTGNVFYVKFRDGFYTYHPIILAHKIALIPGKL